MTKESKTLASVWLLITLLIVGFCVVIRLQHQEIHTLEKHLSSAIEYCIGKENKVQWCGELVERNYK